VVGYGRAGGVHGAAGQVGGDVRVPAEGRRAGGVDQHRAAVGREGQRRVDLARRVVPFAGVPPCFLFDRRSGQHREREAVGGQRRG